ncbi:MAG: AAA family ATPase [Candidatus Cloacimonetes bacterium 4572_55]|nr:MAG: AAA family ATPase [Candidatus Cloacimonetes bacterium 4572_55]
MAENEIAHDQNDQNDKTIEMEGGTYEIIRNRLTAQAKELKARLEKLNTTRKEVFGSIESKLIASARLTTDYNCTPRDMIPIGSQFIFGYNIHFGLRTETKLPDVFSVYRYEERRFISQPLDLIHNEQFNTDFRNLYKYYRHSQFDRFFIIGPYLYMSFRISKRADDLKAFKWAIEGDKLVYIDNRSEHEIAFPDQHEFEWKRTVREQHREGLNPHISIEDRVFVETVGGDLTIKIEDNTDSGEGIYAEDVKHAEQSLDDGEFYYASIGSLILLKIRPYQEKKYRYIVYNEKTLQAIRIDAIKDACVLLPDENGLIFSNGYYLQTGEFKQFDHDLRNMVFEKRIESSNGEDFLYVFYNREEGTYILLSYNLISQETAIPIICHGYVFFPNGELLYNKNVEGAQKHHAVQIWQTPYTDLDSTPPALTDSHLFKIGNKDIVRCMAECHEIYHLLYKEDTYQNLYWDIVKKTTDTIDSYFWLGDTQTFNTREVLLLIKAAASDAIGEFERVVRLRKNSRDQLRRADEKTTQLVGDSERRSYKKIDQYVQTLADLRALRGEVISLKELRYIDIERVGQLEEEIINETDRLSADCITFLTRPDALLLYDQKVIDQKKQIDSLKKGIEAKQLAGNIDEIAGELELLIEIVSNLKIEDPTQTTQIIESISDIYAKLNRTRAEIKRKKKELMSVEATDEFDSQIKLLNQGVINYLDLCDTPEKCDEYLTKLMALVEELEGKFVDFNDFVLVLSEKRDEFYSAFESKKLRLIEARNKRTTTLFTSAERILKGVKNRVDNLQSVNEINGYFASDLMIDKVRNIVSKLVELEDSVKADDIQTRMKTIKEESLRQLKDRLELYVDGGNVIQFGTHRFSINTQPLDVTVVSRAGKMCFHLTGTNFFEEITNPDFLETQEVWDQDLISENREVYRAEYLAYQVLKSLKSGDPLSIEDAGRLTHEEWTDFVQKFMSSRYEEGYIKGVHDHDAAKIASAMVDMIRHIDLLRFPPQTRACGMLCWFAFIDDDLREYLTARLQGASEIIRIFPESREFGRIRQDLFDAMQDFVNKTRLFPEDLIAAAAEYLFYEQTDDEAYIISQEGGRLYKQFQRYLEKNGIQKTFDASLEKLSENPAGGFEMIRSWLAGFLDQIQDSELQEYQDETAILLFRNDFVQKQVVDMSVNRELSDMAGDHPVIDQGRYHLNFHKIMKKLQDYESHIAPRFRVYQQLKRKLNHAFREELRLEDFKPRVLSSFVRNQLIDKVYLPLIGDNLAKQIGVVGEQKRTDRMGLLLLISPPGYGKTTLMEYVADRLGLIFMKINGPAIGRHVTSLDPDEAPNASAREQVEKLNLSLEMGDNVMIYLDDIQHCNPEFLQKFISLCDAQRRIEGIYKGRTKTYDLRGKKVCVVMAGNPYTESGEKFQIPDMLSNRADTYNLGDIIGNNEESFVRSYLENALTSNPILSKLAFSSSKGSRNDLYSFIQLTESGTKGNVEFDATYSAEEVNEYIAALKKMTRVREVILSVNRQYIASAAQADAYRNEPAFLLQGSYRNMNKIAEKVLPIMNDEELETLIFSHYMQEAQTLTSNAEANLLKFKELSGRITNEEKMRWQEIKRGFKKNQAFRGIDSQDRMGQLMGQLSTFGDGLDNIRQTLENGMKSQGGEAESTQKMIQQFGAFAERLEAIRLTIAEGVQASLTGSEKKFYVVRKKEK